MTTLELSCSDEVKGLEQEPKLDPVTIGTTEHVDQGYEYYCE